eukprot:250362_1
MEFKQQQIESNPIITTIISHYNEIQMMTKNMEVLNLVLDGYSLTDAVTAVQLSLVDSNQDKTYSTKFVTTSKTTCICGQQLQKVTAAQLYGGNGALCDICKDECYCDMILWHCDKNKLHPGGFDVCDYCINTVDLCTLDICLAHISNCTHLQRLINFSNIQMDNINLLSVVNTYLHLMDKHNDDEQFEFIVNKFNQCNITTCDRFKRNNRD